MNYYENIDLIVLFFEKKRKILFFVLMIRWRLINIFFEKQIFFITSKSQKKIWWYNIYKTNLNFIYKRQFHEKKTTTFWKISKNAFDRTKSQFAEFTNLTKNIVTRNHIKIVTKNFLLKIMKNFFLKQKTRNSFRRTNRQIFEKIYQKWFRFHSNQKNQNYRI